MLLKSVPTTTLLDKRLEPSPLALTEEPRPLPAPFGLYGLIIATREAPPFPFAPPDP